MHSEHISYEGRDANHVQILAEQCPKHAQAAYKPNPNYANIMSNSCQYFVGAIP